MAGRRPVTHLCPNCLTPATRAGYSLYFDCDDCGRRLVLKNGELQETRAYNAREAVEKGKAKGYLTANQFEELAG